MAVRKVTDCLILLKDHSLQQRSLHELVKNCWDNVLIRDKECVFILRQTEKLIAHRGKVLNNLSQSLKDLPKQLKSKLINAVFGLQQGYSEAVIWEEKCKSALPFTIFNTMTAGDYKIDNFIDPSGHFNDLDWARRFVDDKEQCLWNRFILACFYCFEEKIEYLWNTMKTDRQLPCEGRLADIKSRYKNDDDLVVNWAYQLENKFDELMEENDSYVGFYCSGLFDAIIKGHEYAARFFWKQFSENEKNNFLENPEFSLLADAAEGNHAGLVNFIYSLLSNEQKEELICCISKDCTLTSILSCLLESKYYDSVLDDILKPAFYIPSTIYKWILNSLSFEIAELQIPGHKAIFRELWNYLSQEKQKKVLEDSFIIMNLIKIKDLDLLKMIIQPLSHSDKDRMLLNDKQRAGISALDDFSFGKHYIELRHYLLFFLIDYCPITKTFTLRSDANSVFDKFTKGENFIDFIESIPDSEVNELNEFMEELQVSLKDPDQLLADLEEN